MNTLLAADLLNPCMNTFKVKMSNTNHHIFPIDMLRRDQCWPFTEADSRKLTAATASVAFWLTQFVDIGDSTITLVSRSTPNREAWIEHGWEVCWSSLPPTLSADNNAVRAYWYPENFIDLMRRKGMGVDRIVHIVPQQGEEYPTHMVEYDDGDRFIMAWDGSHIDVKPFDVKSVPWFSKETA